MTRQEFIREILSEINPESSSYAFQLNDAVEQIENLIGPVPTFHLDPSEVQGVIEGKEKEIAEREIRMECVNLAVDVGAETSYEIKSLANSLFEYVITGEL